VYHGDVSPDSAVPSAAGLVDCAAYTGGSRVADVAIDQIGRTLERNDRFVWMGLFEPEQDLLREVQQQFHLHDLAIEDAYNAHQRPKIEQYDTALFVVLRTAQLAIDSRRLEFGETHVFVGTNYVVTVRHGSQQSHVGLRARCESTPHLLSRGPAYVLYSLMDFVVDQFLPIVQHYDEQVQEIEEEILDGVVTTESTARIYRLKRDLLALKRAVTPLVEVCNRLMRFDIPQIPEDTRPYFRDVYDHVVRVNEAIDAQRELLTTALEAKLSLMSVAQNENMKRLSAYAAMIAVPTMIAGIYGMNFEYMPELSWRYGYFGSLVVMALACGALFVGFRRSGWL
jgi:magnesium transporter